MTRERLYLYDTTLRDGAQTAGVAFSLSDKIAVAKMLDTLGLDYIEGGYPGANPTDSAFFEHDHGLAARVVAFGMTRRTGRSAANDPGLAAVLQARVGVRCFVAKSWDYHVEVALGVSLEENLEAIRDTVRAALPHGEVLIDCEHFFDGYKANPAYALSCAKAAYDEGARWVVLCDTNGGTLPDEIGAIVAEIVKAVPGAHLGVHPHDDTGHGVANALAAVRAGVRQIQGTLNGLGERCGNANLVSLIPTLKLKEPYASRFETGVSDAALAELTHVSRALDEILNRQPNRHAPYVGANAFAHKGGIHVSAVTKDPRTYEHVSPQAMGNARKMLVSDQSGRSSVLAELARIGMEVDPASAKVARLLDEVKEREARGWAFEGAEASFELLARRTLGGLPKFFEVLSFRVGVECRHDARGEMATVSEAVVKVRVDGEVLMSVAEGNGPVNALDLALRKDLGRYQPYIDDLRLTDFRVRIIDGGTGAITRVALESTDGEGRVWTTLGVSPNIIDASFQALEDSIIYKLFKAGASASGA